MSVKENDGGTIVQCACGVQLRVPAQANRRVRCPQCRATLVEPAAAPPPQMLSQQIVPTPPSAPHPSSAATTKVHANCMCGARLGFPISAAGRKARCPRCSAILIVPLNESEPQPTAAATAPIETAASD